MIITHSAQDFMNKDCPCQAPSPNPAALDSANKNIVADNDDLDPESSHCPSLLGSNVEMKHIPSVILDDENGARFTSDTHNRAGDLRDIGRREYGARDSGSEHAITNVAC